MRRALFLLALPLFGCERDPTLLGYWEIAAARAGSDADTAEEVTKAGFIEFQSTGSAYAMHSYTWSNAWVPDPRPDLTLYAADSNEGEDFIEGYKEEGETYTVTLTQDASQPIIYAIEEWQGSTVTLSSDQAPPPGADQSVRMFVEYDLER